MLHSAEEKKNNPENDVPASCWAICFCSTALVKSRPKVMVVYKEKQH